MKAFRHPGQRAAEAAGALSLSVAQRNIDYVSHNYEQHFKRLRYFSDTLMSHKRAAFIFLPPDYPNVCDLLNEYFISILMGSI